MSELEMSGLEMLLVEKNRALTAAAKDFRDVEEMVIGIYMREHYPVLFYKISEVEDNLLSLDIVFPGLSRSLSQSIIAEIQAYVQGLFKGEKA